MVYVPTTEFFAKHMKWMDSLLKCEMPTQKSLCIELQWRLRTGLSHGYYQDDSFQLTYSFIEFNGLPMLSNETMWFSSAVVSKAKGSSCPGHSKLLTVTHTFHALILFWLMSVTFHLLRTLFLPCLLGSFSWSQTRCSPRAPKGPGHSSWACTMLICKSLLICLSLLTESLY